MHKDKKWRVRARILVKAYPQPSRQYEETVCVAAIAEDGASMLRLYPIRYRHLPASNRFQRFDLVEMEVERPRGDGRPESRHVVEDSIRVVDRGDRLSEEAKVRLWAPFIAPSLKALHAENKANERSFGIIRPDPNSLRFFARPVAQSDADEQDLAESLYQQSSLFEDSLTPLQKPEYSFGYRFTSDGHPHEHIIHDWEVQTAFFHYRQRYREGALDMLKQEYEVNIPKRNPHFILGTMKAHPRTFIVIGILRSSLDPAELIKQPELF